MSRTHRKHLAMSELKRIGPTAQATAEGQHPRTGVAFVKTYKQLRVNNRIQLRNTGAVNDHEN